MRVMQAGQDQAAFEIDHLRMGAFERFHVGGGADARDGVAGDRHGVDKPPFGVGCVNASVDEDFIDRGRLYWFVRPVFRRAACRQRRQGEGKQGEGAQFVQSHVSPAVRLS